MKYLILSILIACFLSQKVTAQADDDVRKALLGNDPNTTLTTGIGQVVQPVGTPVVRPPGAPPPAPVIQPPPKEVKPSSLERGIKPRKSTAQETKPGLTPSSPKVEGTYELGELPEKSPKDKKTSSSKTMPSDQIVGGGVTYDREVQESLPTQKMKPQRVRIPYSKPPTVQKIPYNR